MDLWYCAKRRRIRTLLLTRKRPQRMSGIPQYYYCFCERLQILHHYAIQLLVYTPLQLCEQDSSLRRNELTNENRRTKISGLYPKDGTSKLSHPPRSYLFEPRVRYGPNRLTHIHTRQNQNPAIELYGVRDAGFCRKASCSSAENLEFGDWIVLESSRLNLT